MGRRDSGGVFKGEDHYLLEKIESDEGDNVQDNIEAVRSFAEKNQEREIYFLVAPNAAEILQDKLPAFAVTEDQKGQLERLRASLPEQIRWIDACGALEAPPGRRNLLPHRSPLDQSGSLVRVSGSKKSYGAE